MAPPPLSADEHAAWRRLAATVKPLGGMATPSLPVARESAPAMAVGVTTQPATVPRRLVVRSHAPADTLDGGWDRRLRRGSVAPDRVLDLHGHTLLSGQAALEAALAAAVTDGARMLLVVTGRPPRAGGPRRGLIRAAIFDWLARSGHADAIAAVRNAHPRHGGAGALYLILRRRRGG